MLTQAEFDEHLEGVRRRKEQEAQWQIECDERRKKREEMADADDDEERPF
jgi:hypothetical protein